MTFTPQQVKEAVEGDQDLYAQIYNHFFGGDKVLAWLNNRGIEDAAEREDMLDEMICEFTRQLHKYKYPKRTIECYMWNVFSQTFLNYVIKKEKLNARFEPLNGQMFRSADMETEVVSLVDVELMGRPFSGKTKTIFEAMSKGFERQDMPHLSLTLKDWDLERVNIKESLVKRGLLTYQERSFI